MFALLRRYRNLIFIVALFAVPLFVYRANAARPADATVLDRIVLVISGPIEKLLAVATDMVSLAWYRYIDSVDASTQNIALRRRVVEQERKLLDAEDIARENADLRRLLELKERNRSLEMIAATVVASGSSPLSRVVRIDKGSMAGIRRGMPVVAEAGLVGRVQRVGFTSADVLLIADEKVTLEVLVVRSRVRGRLVGAGLDPSFKLRIAYVLRSDDVRVGDSVITSGLAGVFPRGIPVGIVSRVEVSPNAQESTVEVEPAVDFSKLDNVMVIVEGTVMEEPLVTPEALRPPALRPAGTSSSAVGVGGAGARGDGGVSRGDAGASKGDAGASKGNAGASKGDAGASKGDAGASKGDAGASKIDAGAPKTDAGAPKIDAGSSRSDAGASKTDAGAAKAEAGATARPDAESKPAAPFDGEDPEAVEEPPAPAPKADPGASGTSTAAERGPT